MAAVEDLDCPTKKKQRKLTKNDVAIYIIPARIQAKRLQILKNCARSNNFNVKDNFSNEVTHVLTEFETREQVLRAINTSCKSGEVSAEILSTKWLTDSVKRKLAITENDLLASYRIKSEIKLTKDDDKHRIEENGQNVMSFLPYACQRNAVLHHQNPKLVGALEILIKHAEYRDDVQGRDSSRALAFSKAAAALKSLSFEVKKMDEIAKLNDIGEHSIKVIQDILEDGISNEVEEIVNSDWFKTMEIFNAVYGIGPSNAKKLFDLGYRSIEDLRNVPSTSKLREDSRIDCGLAFYEDLKCLTLAEAKQIFNILQTEANTLLPGIRVDLTGGFRRGKALGHDADFLFSHPENGAEIAFLRQLYNRLGDKGYILHGQIFSRDYWNKTGRHSTMDSFDKCFLVFRCPTGDQDGSQPEDRCPKLIFNTFDQLCEISKKPRRWKAARVDLVVCPSSQHAYALIGWTGNKHFNRSLRTYANKELNMKLTSHGLWDNTTNKSFPAADERDVFANLNLNYLEPWERNA